ncbi:response regulator [Rummeliibacillus sp. JY-2-4R]
MKSILIVDDSRFMRKHIKNILNESNSYHIVEANSGVQAIELYQQYKPDLVIMDITMPGMSGIDALKIIMNIDPNAKVILCTAVGGQRDVVIEGIQNGAKDVIVKPFFEQLKLTVFSLCHDPVSSF